MKERRWSINTCKFLIYSALLFTALHKGDVFSFRQMSHPPLVWSIRVVHPSYQKLLQSDVSNSACKHHLIAQGLSVLNLHGIPGIYDWLCTILFQPDLEAKCQSHKRKRVITKKFSLFTSMNC